MEAFQELATPVDSIHALVLFKVGPGWGLRSLYYLCVLLYCYEPIILYLCVSAISLC